MPRKKYDEVKVNFVGRFFEDLTKSLVECERAPTQEGDFHAWKSNFGIEVKSSDSNHEFRLPLYQLDTFRRMSDGFPFDNFFLFLYCYHNPYIRDDNGNKITSLSKYKDKIEIRNFLAENLDTLFIFDMTVIDFLFSVCRQSDKSIPLHPGVKSLNIRASYLKRIAAGGWKAMNGDSKNFRPKTFDCEFLFNHDLIESYQLKLKVVALGSAPGIKKLLNSFKLGSSEMKSPA